jgi:hypothetical protein
MVRTVTVKAEVQPDRQVHIQLPADVPVGPVEMNITLLSDDDHAPVTLGDLAEGEFFGIWKDHDDSEDSASLARRLRDEAWRRTG